MISPRMDFDQWTPLGRGDPLKNDPTFDYLPPILDKVYYWKQSPPVNRVQYPSTIASIPSSQTAINYNRRFFLTDFSKKEPAGYMQYTHKRPPQIATMVSGYHYPVPKTPLPMLTPPPYQRPMLMQTTTVEPMDMSLDVGNSVAESKQPPAIRASPPPPPPPPPMSSVRPILSHSVIKVLLENEVDRATITTSSTTTASTTTTARASTTQASPTTDPLFAHYKQSPVTGQPMYLIIQGHSKVKTYGLVSKPDDLSAAHQPAAVQEHNHIGNRPDEPSRRKRQPSVTTF